MDIFWNYTIHVGGHFKFLYMVVLHRQRSRGAGGL